MASQWPACWLPRPSLCAAPLSQGEVILSELVQQCDARAIPQPDLATLGAPPGGPGSPGAGGERARAAAVNALLEQFLGASERLEALAARVRRGVAQPPLLLPHTRLRAVDERVRVLLSGVLRALLERQRALNEAHCDSVLARVTEAGAPAQLSVPQPARVTGGGPSSQATGPTPPSPTTSHPFPTRPQAVQRHPEPPPPQGPGAAGGREGVGGPPHTSVPGASYSGGAGGGPVAGGGAPRGSYSGGAGGGAGGGANILGRFFDGFGFGHSESGQGAQGPQGPQGLGGAGGEHLYEPPAFTDPPSPQPPSPQQQRQQQQRQAPGSAPGLSQLLGFGRGAGAGGGARNEPRG